MTTPFCLSMGYNFSCMIASDTLFNSRVGFRDQAWPMRHCVRWGPSSPPLKGHSPHFRPMFVVASRLDGLRIPLVGLDPGDFVFDGDQPTRYPQKKGTSNPTQFLAQVYCGQTAEDATWYGSRARPRPQCIRWGPSSPRKGHSSPLFLAYGYCVHGRPSQLLLSSCLCWCVLVQCTGTFFTLL